jgi:hypothetical protein
MPTNRYSKIFTALFILVVAFVSVDLVNRPAIVAEKQSSAAASISRNYYPLPPGKQAQLINASRGSDDFYLRHPSWKWSAPSSAVSYPDYYHRHLELSKSAVLGLGASDYFQRHPDLSAPAPSPAKDTDYYFRHLAG